MESKQNQSSYRMKDLKMSEHAIVRFLERNPDEKYQKEKLAALKSTVNALYKEVEADIRLLLSRSTFAGLSPASRARRLIQHRRETEWMEKDGWIFVIAEGTVVSVERKDQWRRDRR